MVDGLEHDFYFSIQLGIIILIDELIFFREVGIPPTRSVFNHRPMMKPAGPGLLWQELKGNIRVFCRVRPATNAGALGELALQSSEASLTGDGRMEDGRSWPK